MVEPYTKDEAREAEHALWVGEWDHHLLQRLGPLWPTIEDNVRMVWENCDDETE